MIKEGLMKPNLPVLYAYPESNIYSDILSKLLTIKVEDSDILLLNQLKRIGFNEKLKSTAIGVMSKLWKKSTGEPFYYAPEIDQDYGQDLYPINDNGNITDYINYYHCYTFSKYKSWEDAGIERLKAIKIVKEEYVLGEGIKLFSRVFKEGFVRSNYYLFETINLNNIIAFIPINKE